MKALKFNPEIHLELLDKAIKENPTETFELISRRVGATKDSIRKYLLSQSTTYSEYYERITGHPISKQKSQKAIDWDVVEKKLKCRVEVSAVAKHFGISIDTLYRRIASELGMTPSEYIQQCRLAGEADIKEKMYDMAMAGNVKMLELLSKSWLAINDIPKEPITVIFKRV